MGPGGLTLTAGLRLLAFFIEEAKEEGESCEGLHLVAMALFVSKQQICCARLLAFLAHVSLLPKGSSSSICYGNCVWNLLAGQCLSHKQTCLAMVKVLSSK